METFNSVVIDDEENAGLLVQSRMATFFPQVRVVEICRDARDALVAILKHKPHFITLDIEMPGMTGLELMCLLRDSAVSPKVLIVSAHAKPDYFQEAIRNGAIDFLIKPYSPDQFREAIERVLHRIGHESDRNQLEEVIECVKPKPKIPLRTASSVLYVPVADIVYIAADGKYSTAYLRSGASEMLMYGISQIHEMLTDYPAVIKIDRSTLVNMHYVTKVTQKLRCVILEADGQELRIKVSASGIEALLRFMEEK